MAKNALIEFGRLSKPATVLIEKISNAVGGIFKPYQMVRIAKAEAETERIRAESQIQVTDLHRRAMHRFFEEEAKKQSNIEAITQESLPMLQDRSTPENVEDDWITNFFDKCRIVSDQDMQRLWSKVLAGEANSPGSFSKRTVNLLADLDKSDAELFTSLCGYGWVVGSIVPLIFNADDEIYNRHGIHFSSLIHLESIGLVQFNSLAGFNRTKLPKRFAVSYYGRVVELTLPQDSENELDLGKVLLTHAGHDLASVCGSSPVKGFFDFVYDRWAAQSYVPSKPTGSGAASDSQ